MQELIHEEIDVISDQKKTLKILKFDLPTQSQKIENEEMEKLQDQKNISS